MIKVIQPIAAKTRWVVLFDFGVFMTANLLAIAGGEDALGIAHACQEGEQINMLSEAKWFAEKGVLNIATAFIYATDLPSLQQIELTRQLAVAATNAVDKRVKAKKKFVRDDTTAAKAVIVIRIATAYLKVRQVKA
jgi:hypothetical protein